MNYSVLQNAVTKGTQEQYPDGIITKVGNDKYTKEEARDKWHAQCRALSADADTIKYKVAVVDSQLNVVDNLVEAVEKAETQAEPVKSTRKSTKSE